MAGDNQGGTKMPTKNEGVQKECKVKKKDNLSER